MVQATIRRTVVQEAGEDRGSGLSMDVLSPRVPLRSMRIVAGKYRGRRLRTNPGQVTRPITDRAKESLFEHLSAWRSDVGRVSNLPNHGSATDSKVRQVGNLPHNARVADIFAGTGTLGLEALSRGARSVVFIEQDRKAVQLLRHNVEALGVSDVCLCWRTDALRCSYRPRGVEEFVPFDVIFCDPPFRMIPSLKPGTALFRCLERLARLDVSAPDAILCLRTPRSAEFETPSCWSKMKVVTSSGMEIHLCELVSGG